MTKIANAKHKLGRKFSANLWGNAKDTFAKHNSRPGQHGSAPKGRISDYGLQLRAKQRLKFSYGRIPEKQFLNTFKAAEKLKGNTKENFIALLESRLDTVVYRANFAPTPFAGRQLVSHKHVLVNGEIVNIPSYRLKIGDIVQVREKSRGVAMIMESLQNLVRDVPPYLALDKEAFSIKLVSKPLFEEVPYASNIEPHLVTEFYSR